MNSRQRADLDRYLTGNWGEDQLRGLDDEAEAAATFEAETTLPLFGEEPPACVCHPVRGVHSTCCPEYIPARFPKPEPSANSSAREQAEVPARSFDLKTGERLKAEGMALAATSRAALMDIVRAELMRIARTRADRCATADDAQEFLVAVGRSEELGNAAGSLFRGGEWNFTGEWRKSARVSNHARVNRVWKLK